MKYAVALALFVASASASYSDELVEWSLREHFSIFEQKFAKAYKTLEERETRFMVFIENLEEVMDKNAALRAEGADEVHGITKFSDWTKEEFAQRMLNPNIATAPTPKMEVAVPLKNASEVAASFDWREEGVVTPVKNQAYCGSCWAHSAVETVESAYAKAGNGLTSLSVQQVVSCDVGGTDQGCNGGWYYSAWMDYMEGAGGLTTEENYPYDTATAAGHASACDADKAAQVVAGTAPTSYKWATPECTSLFCNNQDEDTLKANLASYGPVSIACDASSWNSYTGGIMTSASCKSSSLKLDHAIQLVGYNTEGDVPYWIVRNSWTTDWGEDGFIYLKMGENTCGIADKAAMVEL